MDYKSTHRFSKAYAFREKIILKYPDLLDNKVIDIPNKKFWDYYHKEGKQELLESGIQVRKNDDGTYRIHLLDMMLCEQEYIEIQDQLERHKPYCTIHQQEVRTINKSLFNNGQLVYAFYCNECKDEIGSWLPHGLVEYCLNERGFELIHISRYKLNDDRRHKYYMNEQRSY